MRIELSFSGSLLSSLRRSFYDCDDSLTGLHEHEPEATSTPSHRKPIFAAAAGFLVSIRLRITDGTKTKIHLNIDPDSWR